MPKVPSHPLLTPKVTSTWLKVLWGRKWQKAEGQDVPLHSSDLAFLNAYCLTLFPHFVRLKRNPNFKDLKLVWLASLLSTWACALGVDINEQWWLRKSFSWFIRISLLGPRSFLTCPGHVGLSYFHHKLLFIS